MGLKIDCFKKNCEKTHKTLKSNFGAKKNNFQMINEISGHRLFKQLLFVQSPTSLALQTACLPQGQPVFCRKCQLPMKLQISMESAHYLCTKCKTTQSIRQLLFAVNSHIDDRQFYQLLCLWSLDLTNKETAEWIEVSHECVQFYFDLFREKAKVKLQHMINKEPFQDLAEVDESQFGKRKYNRGRIGRTDWFFGMCDADPGGRVYIVKVDRRDHETLCPIIFSCVEQDTVVMSDMWAAYGPLDKYGYPHLTVNHSENFMDPDTEANTQRIESLWGTAKKWMRKHSYRWVVRREDYLHEWCWKYNNQFNFTKIWTTIFKS
jgi:transposase-like protein